MYEEKRLYLCTIPCANNLLLITVIVLILFLITEPVAGDAISWGGGGSLEEIRYSSYSTCSVPLLFCFVMQ